MYAATGNAVLPPRPFLHRLLIRSWSDRHPSLSIIVRIKAGIWSLGLGIFLLIHGYWVGLAPAAGSALLFWAAYIVARGTSNSRRNGQSPSGHRAACESRYTS